ncbi:hypothetical protein GCM10009610_67710 [Pseudonocardia xinjiangensis]
MPSVVVMVVMVSSEECGAVAAVSAADPGFARRTPGEAAAPILLSAPLLVRVNRAGQLSDDGVKRSRKASETSATSAQPWSIVSE